MFVRRLIAIMFFALPLMAQEEKLASDALVDKATELFGIPEGSKYYKALRAQLKSGIDADIKAAKEAERTGKKVERVFQDNESKQLATLFPKVSEDAPILKHYRGTQGIPLPGNDELISPFSDIPMDEVKKEITEKYLPEYKKSYEALLENPSLPTCQESRTFKAEVEGPLGKEYDDQVFMDVLYLPENLNPLTPETYFGQTATLRTYVSESGNPVSIVARTLGVWCLPYRIRITGKNRFVHIGADALKNFERNQNGQGELNKEIEKQIQYLGLYSGSKKS